MAPADETEQETEPGKEEERPRSPLNPVFGEGYAGAYDLLYVDKSYRDECTALEAIFREFASEPPVSVLDLGCGTGGHALILSERGYAVTGVDRSSNMLSLLREKAKAGSTLIALERNVLGLELGEKFDVCVAMFAVFGYQCTDEEVAEFIRAAARHTKPGGLFIFDFWYGPAVLAIRPEERVKVVEEGAARVVRTASPTMDTRRHTVTTRYKLSYFNGAELLREVHELHRMRYFFPPELDRFLGSSGFELVHLGSFAEHAEPATDTTWNAIAVARRHANTL